MRCYAAPMEGLTGYVFRNAHRACFPGVDGYFTPFVAPNQNHEFSSRELNDILPEHNHGTPVIPQILTNRPEDFLWAAQIIADMGYAEVNLNLGCPSPTVVTKGKGSGMLSDPDALNAFLDAIYSRAHVKISIKTRVGLSDEGNWMQIIEVFNQYPLSQLIVHPRIQSDLYKKPVRTEAFTAALQTCVHPLCYNGDLFSPGAMQALESAHTGLYGLMCGRGLIANPHLFGAAKGLHAPDSAILRDYHDRILQGYLETMPGDKALLFKMKELWHYMAVMFPDRGNFDKKLKKVGKTSDYTALVNDLFARCQADFSAFYEV